jgi:rubrerythrin
MPEGTGIDRLRESKTIGDILHTAMAFERTARDFYAQLATRVSKPIRELVRELAEEEARHFALFEELTVRDDVQAVIAERVTAPANDHKFSDYVHLPELGAHPDDQAILQYAMGREHAAMEQYAALAAEVPGGPIKDLFTYLSKEELAHKAELEKKYYELVFPTNV